MNLCRLARYQTVVLLLCQTRHGRKPDIGMILEAAKKYDINLKKSFMVGDSTRDIQAGNRAKLKTILVKTGHGGKDIWQLKSKPDFVVKNLSKVVDVIKNYG